MPGIPVDPGFTWTAGFSGVGAFGIIGLLIRQLGPWRKQASDERDGDFSRLRSDITEIKAEARSAFAAAQRLENMVACMRPAISILTAEVKRLDPESSANAALLQVQELMAMAAAGDLGTAHGLVGLATLRGTGE